MPQLTTKYLQIFLLLLAKKMFKIKFKKRTNKLDEKSIMTKHHVTLCYHKAMISSFLHSVWSSVFPKISKCSDWLFLEKERMWTLLKIFRLNYEIPIKGSHLVSHWIQWECCFFVCLGHAHFVWTNITPTTRSPLIRQVADVKLLFTGEEQTTLPRNTTRKCTYTHTHTQKKTTFEAPIKKSYKSHCVFSKEHTNKGDSIQIEYGYY